MESGVKTMRPQTPVTTWSVAVLLCLAGAAQLRDPTLISRAQVGPALVADEPWRLVSYSLVHVGVGHLAGNVAALIILGRLLEPVLGHLGTAAVLVCGVAGGGVAVWAWTPWSDTVVGASGGVWALFAAGGVAVTAHRIRPDLLRVMVAANIASAVLTPGVSWQAHLGGFAAGAVAAAIVLVSAGHKTADARQAPGPAAGPADPA